MQFISTDMQYLGFKINWLKHLVSQNTPFELNTPPQGLSLAQDHIQTSMSHPYRMYNKFSFTTCVLTITEIYQLPILCTSYLNGLYSCQVITPADIKIYLVIKIVIGKYKFTDLTYKVYLILWKIL